MTIISPAFSKVIQGPLVNEANPDLGTTNDASETSAEFETFLNLLTAQIRNQDPLSPLDSTQFVDQLATFSGLELQAKGNALLEDIAEMIALGQATSEDGA
jgi:flagellar hook assembly protein FlgD